MPPVPGGSDGPFVFVVGILAFWAVLSVAWILLIEKIRARRTTDGDIALGMLLAIPTLCLVWAPLHLTTASVWITVALIIAAIGGIAGAIVGGVVRIILLGVGQIFFDKNWSGDRAFGRAMMGIGTAVGIAVIGWFIWLFVHPIP